MCLAAVIGSKRWGFIIFRTWWLSLKPLLNYRLIPWTLKLLLVDINELSQVLLSANELLKALTPAESPGVPELTFKWSRRIGSNIVPIIAQVRRRLHSWLFKMDWDCQTCVPGVTHVNNCHLCWYLGLNVGFSLYKVKNFIWRIIKCGSLENSISYKTARCFTVSLDVLL